MSYKIVREPYLLPETVSMLYLFFQQQSPQRLASQKALPPSPAANRRNAELSAIIGRVCADVNRETSPMRLYFERIESDSGFDGLCLAKFMVGSFLSMRYTGFRESIDDIHKTWNSLLQNNASIRSFDDSGLVFSNGEVGDLFEHISSLELPAQSRLDLYRILRNFDVELDIFADLVEPYANRLAEEYRAHPWLFEDVCDYWTEVFERTSPLEFLQRAAFPNGEYTFRGDMLVCFSMMNYRDVSYVPIDDFLSDGEYNIMCIGSAILLESVLRTRALDLDSIATTLKLLSDRRRLEILQRLGQKHSYCHELSEVMGVDPGNLSRSLTALHNCGFLTQERRNLRCYYRLNPDALHDFFQVCESLLIPNFGCEEENEFQSEAAH